MRDDDDLPVLSAVVRGGNAAVIRSMRLDVAAREHEPTHVPHVTRIDLGHAATDAGADARYELDDTLPLDEETGASVRHARTGVSAEDPSRDRRGDDPDLGTRAVDLDDLVDRIVDRHVAALRRDVRDAPRTRPR